MLRGDDRPKRAGGDVLRELGPTGEPVAVHRCSFEDGLYDAAVNPAEFANTCKVDWPRPHASWISRGSRSGLRRRGEINGERGVS